MVNCIKCRKKLVELLYIPEYDPFRWYCKSCDMDLSLQIVNGARLENTITPRFKLLSLLGERCVRCG